MTSPSSRSVTKDWASWSVSPRLMMTYLAPALTASMGMDAAEIAIDTGLNKFRDKTIKNALKDPHMFHFMVTNYVHTDRKKGGSEVSSPS